MDRASAITRIDQIDEILSSGVEEGRIGDRQVRYNFSQLRTERSRLYNFLQGGRVRVGRYNSNVTP